MRQQISITTRWSKFFKLKCLHDFYKDGSSPDLTFVPMPETYILMKNLRLLFRPQRAGFIVLFNPNDTERWISGKNNKNRKLSFLIRNKNPEFNNFSNIPFEDIEKSFYFSNLNTNITKGGQKLIHSASFLSAPPRNVIYSKDRALSFSFSKKISSNEFGIQDVRGNSVKIEDHLQGDLKMKSDRWKIPLRYFENGKYQLKFKGSDDIHFYVTDKVSGQNWGIVDIYLDGLTKAYSLYDTKDMLKPNYFIRFQARETYWKYILINQERNGNSQNMAITDSKVLCKGEPIEFSKPKPIILNNGKQAFFIESKKPIKLEEVQAETDRYEMKIKKDSRWMPRKVKLPKPDVRMLKPDKESKKIYSTTYIYV